MFHACVERFDVTDTVGKILGTKRALDMYTQTCAGQLQCKSRVMPIDCSSSLRAVWCANKRKLDCSRPESVTRACVQTCRFLQLGLGMQTTHIIHNTTHTGSRDVRRRIFAPTAAARLRPFHQLPTQLGNLPR